MLITTQGKDRCQSLMPPCGTRYDESGVGPWSPQVGGGRRLGGRCSLERRARVSVWPGRRRVPGLLSPPLGEHVEQNVSLATSPDARLRRWVGVGRSATARRSLCPDSGFGTTEARPPRVRYEPPVPHGGSRVLSSPSPNSAGDFRSRKNDRHRFSPTSVFSPADGETRWSSRDSEQTAESRRQSWRSTCHVVPEL
jgi:hypothetical protein